MNITRRIFDHKGAPILAAVFIVLLIAESKRPLRKRKQSRLNRMVINTLISIPAYSLLRFALIPVMVTIALKNTELKSGLNYQYNAPPAVKGLVAFLILDYTNYIWHILNHKIPLLWRFHLVHHCDPDLDVTTAVRFHFGEIIGSLFFRGFCVFLSGVTPLNMLLYEIVFETATQFHHSNWKLPYELEKKLNKIIVTPRMHGIHHSNIQQQADSNYSVIFSFWDRLHHTFKLGINQDKIITGVPSYSDFREQTIGYLLRLPFNQIRPWEITGPVTK